MEPDSHPKSIERILRNNPEIEGLRIDAVKHDVEVGFAEVIPDSPAISKIDASLARELPDPGAVIHSPEVCHSQEQGNADEVFHHHHLGSGVIEFHRGHLEPQGAVLWRHFKIPRWQNRPSSPESGDDYRKMLLLAGICGVTALAGHFLERTLPTGAAVAFAASYLCGGWYASREVFGELRRGKIDVHFLMLIVAVGALFVRAWTEGATLLFLFSLSGGLEQFAHHRTQKTINSLLKAAPKQVLRRTGDVWVAAAIEDVQSADELLVKPGELFPVDGFIMEGETSADESALSGESIPVAKRKGDHVSGGTLNLEGKAVIRVERTPQNSAVQRIIALIETAQQQKAPAQRFTDAFSRYYTWVVLIISAIAFAVLLASGHTTAEALYRTMTLLVVASPCALVLSIPSAILVAIAAGARQGILFRGGVAVENLAAVNQFAFDKTGTLTRGKLRVARIEGLNGTSEAAVLKLAASVGQFSTHPLSRAIASEAQRRGLTLAAVSDLQNDAGFGMRGVCEGTPVLVGSRALLAKHGIAIPVMNEDHAFVEVWVAGEKALGVIDLSDELRPESKPVIARLKETGVAVALLTGDRRAVANRIAAALDIQDVRAGLRPADKLDCIHRWQAEGRKVAMVGDGINDAPSLTAADVAIGMGSHGSDAALEQADVVLMHDKIENVSQALALSRAARAIIRQNLVISLGVVLLLFVSAVLNRITLSVGVIGHEGSTVIVVLNGLRLLGLGRFTGTPAKTGKDRA
ncbi:heavy metal translocating P-type ATPase [Chthoniobacter flavus Ellin428]|uniref:Heavy metal translocating P-type ATPase n=1 Tax=Chthoniobacter flavus Ellin428 TaxID=497964 RepID=B4D2X2_9BACT|nr:cation-translocating P-type ATPase [Chthoniobacter flavus]EDY19083.1 heavy metal translocating P-type ATPase [Chthoniobacter flavus Ellin428]TCO86844.1 Cd2+/Zn2+-exporting ATPase [Chthoniobacter flavus]